MSLKELSAVDIIVKSPHTGGYDLIVVDSGDTDDETERYTLLVEKLTNYASFVAAGDLVKSCPDAEGQTVRFCVVCQAPPNNAMLQVQAISPSSDPTARFPVLVATKDDYLKSITPAGRPKDTLDRERKNWWNLL